MEQFEEYLRQKRIDPQQFREALPEEWNALVREFLAAGEKSFDQQKKFLLNPWRSEFPLPEDPP
ncbi:MAG: hypothetical protein AAGN35_22570 [Bacteroidota bacterium]